MPKYYAKYLLPYLSQFLSIILSRQPPTNFISFLKMRLPGPVCADHL